MRSDYIIASNTGTDSKNWYQGIDSASLFSLAGRYDNPTRFLVNIDCSKMPAQDRPSTAYRCKHSQLEGWALGIGIALISHSVLSVIFL